MNAFFLWKFPKFKLQGFQLYREKIKKFSDNHGNNVLELYRVLENFGFNTNEAEVDIYNKYNKYYSITSKTNILCE